MDGYLPHANVTGEQTGCKSYFEITEHTTYQWLQSYSYKSLCFISSQKISKLLLLLPPYCPKLEAIYHLVCSKRNESVLFTSGNTF